jgi:transcriptional regulator with XRE-family HTH domain
MIKLAIKSHRDRLGLTQKELANLLGVTENTVANWENGRSGFEQFARVVLLCNTLNCEAKDLIEEAIAS